MPAKTITVDPSDAFFGFIEIKLRKAETLRVPKLAFPRDNQGQKKLNKISLIAENPHVTNAHDQNHTKSKLCFLSIRTLALNLHFFFLLRRNTEELYRNEFLV